MTSRGKQYGVFILMLCYYWQSHLSKTTRTTVKYMYYTKGDITELVAVRQLQVVLAVDIDVLEETCLAFVIWTLKSN